MPLRSSPVTPLQLAGAVAASGAAGLTLAASGDWKIAFGLLAAAAFATLGLVRPTLFLALFLLVRPLLDDLSQVTAGLPSSNVAGGLGVLLIGVFLVLILTWPGTMRPRGTVALLALLAVAGVAAVESMLTLSGVGFEPVSELARLTALLALFVLAANLFDTPRKATALFLIVGLSALAPAVFGIVELIKGPEVSETTGVARISGTFVGPNPFGAYLGLAALVLMFLPAGVLSRRVRWPAVVVLLVPLAATYSRMGWALFLLGLVILGWRGYKPLVIGLGCVAVAVMFAVPTIRERALPFVGPTSGDQVQSEGYESFTWRLDNWRLLLDKWENKPLLGYGLRSTTFVNPRAPSGNENVVGGGYQAHHTVVKALVEGGVVMLFATFAFLMAMLGTSHRMARDRWELQPLARIVFATWTLVLIVGLTTDDPTELTAMMYAALALTGALAGAHHKWREGRLEGAHPPETSLNGAEPTAPQRPAAVPAGG
jgi:O-antigen ligase